jgi:hypothetical protein
VWEAWKAGFMAFHAFHTLSFPWPASSVGSEELCFLTSWKGLWLLKNSSSGRAHKFHRTRMPYKRLSRLGWTFSIPKSAAIFSERDFFNTHDCYHQLTNFGGDLVVGRAHRWIASTAENHIFCHRVAVAEALVLPSPFQSVPLYSRIFAVSSALEGPK